MKNIFTILAVIVAITYSLKLINSQSDLLVFVGLGAAGLAFYVFVLALSKIYTQIKSRL